MLSDGDHIRNLLGTYCDRIDAADYDGVGALFGEDGSAADRRRRRAGTWRGGRRRFYRGLIKLHDGRQRTKHVVGNTVLEPQGDEEVVARSSYVVLQATDDLPLQPIIAGR